MTHTKTYNVLHPWAETTPWECLVRPTNCCAGPEHDHDPMVNDPCAVLDCREPMLAGEVCYAVCEIERRHGLPPQNPNGKARQREAWVCWRHVRPDDGPIRVSRPAGEGGER